jgi:hypothetical protein
MIESNIPCRNLRGPRIDRALVRVSIAMGLMLASAASMAQTSVTLYGGGRAGGELIDQNNGDTAIKFASGAAGAASFDWILADGRQAQIFYSFQHSALPGSAVDQAGDFAVNVSYLHAGGRVFFDGSYATNASYLVGGLGITLFTPDQTGLSTEVRPSMNLGFGYQWMVSRQIALRTELRGHFTLINSGGGFFCNGGCTAAIRGDTLSQFEGLVGLSFGL